MALRGHLSNKDDLISRSLVTSAKSPFPNKWHLQVSGIMTCIYLWGGGHFSADHGWEERDEP